MNIKLTFVALSIIAGTAQHTLYGSASTFSKYQLTSEEQQKLNALQQAVINKNLDQAYPLIKDIRENIIEKYIKMFDQNINDIINPTSVNENINATRVNYIDAINTIHTKIKDIIHEPYWYWRNQMNKFAQDFVPALDQPSFTFEQLLQMLRKADMDQVFNIYTKVVLPLKEVENDLTQILTDFITAYLQSIYYQKIGLNTGINH